MDPIIIGIDTGNRCIKSVNEVFVAGVQEVTSPNKGIFREALTYNGKSYVLTTHRNSYMADKTKTDTYFVLSLFAVRKELLARGYEPTQEPLPVRLAVGLPPRDYARLKVAFETYFNRGVVLFSYLNEQWRIQITGVDVYPQAFAAISSIYRDIKRLAKAYVIDIGGYTTDIIELHSGMIDPNLCWSINNGMIHFYNRVAQEIEAKTGKAFDEEQIDIMLQSCSNGAINTMYEQMVDTNAKQFAANLMNKLNEFGADLSVSTGVFVGGGSLRLRSFLASPDIVPPLFVEAINANASGYESMSSSRRAR